MDQKQYVDNEDPVRPKTSSKAHDISEIDSLIFADQQQRSDDEPVVQRYSDDVLHDDSEEFSEQVHRTDSRQQAGRRKTWKEKKSFVEPEEDIFEKAMKDQRQYQEKLVEEEDPIMKLL